MQGTGQQLALELGQDGDIFMPPAPPGLRPTTQRAESRAGRIDQDPVVAVRFIASDIPSVPAAHMGRVLRHRTQGGAHQVGPVGTDLIGEQVGALLTGPGGQQSRLAARAGAQVEPALVTPFERGLGGDERHQLTALVLDPGPGVPDRLDPAGISSDHDNGERADPPQAGFDVVDPVGLASDLGQGLRGDETGPGAQSHLGVGVVGDQERLQLVGTATVGGQGLAQRLDDPLWVGLGTRQGDCLIRGALA